MSSLGVRCAGDGFAYVVVEGAVNAPELIEEAVVSMPKGGRPEQLAWLRNEVLEIIERRGVTSIAFKAAESNAMKKDLGRAEAEGVLQETCHNSGIPVIRRVKTQIRTDLGFTKQARYVDEALPESLAALPKNRHEAALASLSALVHA